MATLKDLLENEDKKVYSHVEAFTESSFSDLVKKVNDFMKTKNKKEEIICGPVSLTYNPDAEKYVAMVTCYSHKPIEDYIGGDYDFDCYDRWFLF